jgi:hypothetical protein
VLPLLGLAACSTLVPEALSGSSIPPAASPGSLSGGVLVSPGGAGMAAAEEIARQACEEHHLQATISNVGGDRGQVRLAYTCE